MFDPTQKPQCQGDHRFQMTDPEKNTEEEAQVSSAKSSGWKPWTDQAKIPPGVQKQEQKV